MSETTDTSERRLLSSDMICTRCGAREPSSRRHCGACHCTFAALSLFDGHRKASGELGVCLDPAELEGYEFRDGCWRGPEATDEMREQWAKMRSESSAPVAELNLTNLGG